MINGLINVPNWKGDLKKIKSPDSNRTCDLSMPDECSTTELQVDSDMW